MRNIFLFFGFLLGNHLCAGKLFMHDNPIIRHRIDSIISQYKAKTGVASVEIETGDTMSFYAEKKYAMQSVYKFPLALYVLDLADKGKIKLQSKIFVSKKVLDQNTWSPLKQQFPNGNVYVSVADLLKYSASMSDNIACDLLFKLVKGPKKVEQYLIKKGFKGIHLVSTEEQMHKNPKLMYDNCAYPVDMSNLLVSFYNKKLISDSATNFLMRLMVESPTSKLRIKGLLPDGVVVAHKTGTGSGAADTVHNVVNDVGIISMPNGHHLALTVFVSDSPLGFDESEKIIAAIAKELYDEFSRDSKKK
jgi:beta-lactamase class A